jgi:hypothetical protein
VSLAHAAIGRFLLLARALSASAVRSAAPVGVPLYFGVAIACAVLFGPKALEARTVTRAMIGSPGLALGLFSAWIVLSLPVARATLDLPTTFFLRALPVPRWQFLAITGAHLAAVELPWIVLFARGEGLAGGAFGAASAISAHCLLIARAARGFAVFVFLASALAVLISVAAPLPMPARLAAAAFAAVTSLSIAWRRAPERASRRLRVPLPKRPTAALALSYLLEIRRGNAAVLGRAVLFTAVGGAATPLIARGYDIRSAPALSALSLGIAAGFIAISASGIAGAVLRAERRARWMLDAMGVGGGSRAGAAGGAAAGCGAALGSFHGALVGLGAESLATESALAASSDPSSLETSALTAVALSVRLIGLGGLWGAALGALTAWNARLAELEGPREGGRALARLVVLTAAAIVSVAFLGEAALAAGVVAALLLSVRSAQSAADLRPPLCAHSHARRRLE